VGKYLSTEAVRRWRAANPERAREANRRTYEKHRAATIARAAEWGKANPEKKRAAARATAKRLYEADPEKYREKHRQWGRENPDKVRHNTQVRRARKIGAAGSHTLADLMARFEVHGNRCVYCGAAGQLTPDHMIPLSRGGSDWPANIVPACLRCNQSKHTRTYFEFLEVA
jgi:5-methylcytosine-specific restriction endonuclease McrA